MSHYNPFNPYVAPGTCSMLPRKGKTQRKRESEAVGLSPTNVGDPNAKGMRGSKPGKGRNH